MRDLVERDLDPQIWRQHRSEMCQLTPGNPANGQNISGTAMFPNWQHVVSNHHSLSLFAASSQDCRTSSPSLRLINSLNSASPSPPPPPPPPPLYFCLSSSFCLSRALPRPRFFTVSLLPSSSVWDQFAPVLPGFLFHLHHFVRPSSSLAPSRHFPSLSSGPGQNSTVLTSDGPLRGSFLLPQSPAPSTSSPSVCILHSSFPQEQSALALTQRWFNLRSF